MKALLELICIALITTLLFSGCSEKMDPEAEWTELSKKTTALFQKGEYSEAVEIGKEALNLAEKTIGPKQQDKIATSLFNLASAYYLSSDFKEAESLFHRALKINTDLHGADDPSVAHILKALSGIYYAQNYFSKAKDNLRKSLTIYLKKYGNKYPSVPVMIADLGNIHKIQCKLDDAIKLYQAALELKPDDTKIKDSLKIVTADRKDVNSLVLKFQEKLLINPEDYQLQWRLGNLFVCNEEIDKAIQQYEKALSIKSNYFDALFDVAKLYEQKAEYDKAIAAYEKALEQHKNRPDLMYFIATAYAMQNNPEESISWLKKLIDMGFKNWKRLEADKNLENLRASSEYQKIIKNLKG